MEALRKNRQKIISLKQAKKIIIFLIFIIFFDFFLYPAPAMASQIINTANISQDTIFIKEYMDSLANITEFKGKLPENNNAPLAWSKYTVVTAYNSDPGQTDNSPCVTANNFNVCDHGIENTIAANFLPFGARVKIPELFGDRVFIVRDRMNKRFYDRVDVWMIKKPAAINFGVKVAKIEVLK